MSISTKNKVLILYSPALLLWAVLVNADTLVLQQGIPSNPTDSSLDINYASSGEFIVSDLLISISRTVAVKVDESKTALAVVAGSARGRTVFAGHTDIGAVAPCFIVVSDSDEDITPASAESLGHLDISSSTGCDISSS